MNSPANSHDAMTNPAPTLHALFPTLVYQSNCPHHGEWKPLFEDALNNFGFQPESRDSSRHFAGEYHGQILLHQHLPLRSFFDYLAGQVADYLRVLGMKPHFFDMNCLKTWFVCCDTADDEADAMLAHNHSCSDVSWVYYVDVAADCGPIRFHSGRQLGTSLFQSAFHYDWQNENKSSIDRINTWNRDTYTIAPQPGDLLLFPGHQLHSIDANRSDTVRISVAGDIALTLKPEFKDLEFGRTAPEHWLKLGLTESTSE